jgi:hypothetical protein
MPRIGARWWLAFVLGGCMFDASYQSGQTTCSDGRCPAGLVCSAARVCVTPGQDASTGSDASLGSDAHVALLTCGDPGVLASGVATSGTTIDRSNTLDSLCAGAIMNGPDAVYAIAITASQSLQVSLAGSAALSAYVLASCVVAPNTPACAGNMAAAAGGSPITASPAAAGTYYVIVDSALAAGSGAYTLTVTAD